MTVRIPRPYAHGGSPRTGRAPAPASARAGPRQRLGLARQIERRRPPRSRSTRAPRWCGTQRAPGARRSGCRRATGHPASPCPRTASSSAGKPASTRTSGRPMRRARRRAHRLVGGLRTWPPRATPADRRPPGDRPGRPGWPRPAALRCPPPPAPRPPRSSRTGAGARRTRGRALQPPQSPCGRQMTVTPAAASRRPYPGGRVCAAAGPVPAHGPMATPGRSPPAIAASRASRAGSSPSVCRSTGQPCSAGHLQHGLDVAAPGRGRGRGSRR